MNEKKINEKVNALFRDKEHEGFVGSENSYLTHLKLLKEHSVKFKDKTIEEYVDMLYDNRQNKIKRKKWISDMSHSLYLNCFLNNEVNNYMLNHEYLKAKTYIEKTKQKYIIENMPGDFNNLYKTWSYDSKERTERNEDVEHIIEEAFFKAYKNIEKHENEYIAKESNKLKSYIENHSFEKALMNKEFDKARVIALKNKNYLYEKELKETQTQKTILNQKISKKAYLTTMDKVAKKEFDELERISKLYIQKFKENKLYSNLKNAFNNEDYDEAKEYLYEVMDDILKHYKDLTENETKALNYTFDIFYKKIEKSEEK